MKKPEKYESPTPWRMIYRTGGANFRVCATHEAHGQRKGQHVLQQREAREGSLPSSAWVQAGSQAGCGELLSDERRVLVLLAAVNNVAQSTWR